MSSFTVSSQHPIYLRVGCNEASAAQNKLGIVLVGISNIVGEHGKLDVEANAQNSAKLSCSVALV